MIKAVIIDDEKNARTGLSNLIQRYLSSKVLVVQSCDSIKTGVAAIKEQSPDVVFLDIRMPEEDGFAIFNYFDTIHFEIIFTTAYAEHAVKAIRKAAFDYLTKPINHIELIASIKRLEAHKEHLRRQDRLNVLLENLTPENSEFQRVAIPVEDGFEILKLNRIVYCQADSNYCKITLIDGREILVSKTLKKIEELLDNSIFFKVHKSYIINLNYLEKYTTKSSCEVTMTNGITIPVSQRKKTDLKDVLQDRH